MGVTVFRQHSFAPNSIWARYKEAFVSVHKKVEHLQKVDEENEKLNLENANLRVRVEALQFDCRAQDAAKKTQELGLKFNQETGSRVGRNLASITYKIPPEMLPYQLFPLAVSYFKSRQDEKAAVILTFLTGMEDDRSYRTPRNLLMTGIAWYRLDHYSAAQEYFEQVLKSDVPTSDERGRQIYDQALLWKALTFERLGKHKDSQLTLRRLLDHNPHSREAAWVNGREAIRATASKH